MSKLAKLSLATFVLAALTAWAVVVRAVHLRRRLPLTRHMVKHLLQQRSQHRQPTVISSIWAKRLLLMMLHNIRQS